MCRLFLRGEGKFDPEGAAVAGVGEDADAAVHEFDGAFDDGEADACTGVLGSRMEFLEHSEHALSGFRGNTDAVVGDGDSNKG